MTPIGRWPRLEDNLGRWTALEDSVHQRHLLSVDNLHWKTTYIGKQPTFEKDQQKSPPKWEKKGENNAIDSVQNSQGQGIDFTLANLYCSSLLLCKFSVFCRMCFVVERTLYCKCLPWVNTHLYAFLDIVSHLSLMNTNKGSLPRLCKLLDV